MTYEDNFWYYNNEPLTSDHIIGYIGMVYLLENTLNSKKYVGKKFFWKPHYRMVNKKKKKSIVESDWKDYYGSNKVLQEEIEQIGKDKIKRTVLHLCKTKTQCAYYELKEQVERDVLFLDEYYNGFVGGKINGKYLEKL